MTSTRTPQRGGEPVSSWVFLAILVAVTVVFVGGVLLGVHLGGGL